MKKNKGPDLEKYLEGRGHRFVNYAQGAKIYQVTYWAFVRAARMQILIIRFEKHVSWIWIFLRIIWRHPEVVARFEANRRSCKCLK